MKSVDGIIIHYISAKNTDQDDPFSLESIIKIFEEYQLSAHYLIERDGNRIGLVPLPKIAWHAGKSRMNGRDRCNNFCVGIELVGGRDWEFTDEQIAACKQLCAELMTVYQIPLDMIQGHDQVRKQWNDYHKDNKGAKKFDPGLMFDWDDFYESLRYVDNGHFKGDF